MEALMNEAFGSPEPNAEQQPVVDRILATRGVTRVELRKASPGSYMADSDLTVFVNFRDRVSGSVVHLDAAGVLTAEVYPGGKRLGFTADELTAARKRFAAYGEGR